jgi:hypothetical protein
MFGYIYGSTSSGLTFTDAGSMVATKATLVVGNNYNSASGNVLNVYSNGHDGILFANAAGNVGIGTTTPGTNKLKVAGAAEVTGNFTIGGTLTVNNGADLAEEFGTTEELAFGTVVVMAEDGIKTAKPCEVRYDKKVIGVVSDNPSVIMGRIPDKVKAIVALTGVVKVKVTTENGEIKKGDLLATSDLRGHAMKATEERVGTIIGKALENFSGQTGEITALINLQ